MTSEARNTILVVGADQAPNPPEARNTILVVGADQAPNPPEVRNVLLVVGADDPAAGGGGSTGPLLTGRRRQRGVFT